MGAHGSVLRASLGADVAHDPVAGVHPDPHFEFGATARLQLRVHAGHGALHRDAAGHRPFGVVGARDRRAEHHQNRIADDLVDRAVETVDHLDHRFQIQIQRADDFLRRQLLGERGEATQVGHENGELPLLTTDLESVRRFENAGHDLLGHVAAEGVAYERVDAGQLLVLAGQPHA